MKLLLMLQSRTKDITVNYLASYFNVSRRTIFRDLRTLQELEVPVSYDEEAGYSIPRGYSIPPITFSQKEIATIMVGISFVKSQHNQSLIEDAKAVALKIMNVVPPESREIMKVLGDRVVIDPYQTLAEKDSGGADWYILSSAIAEGKEITFQYSKKSRRLKPLILAYYSDHWSVTGLYNRTDEIRSFRLEAMEQLKVDYDSIPRQHQIGDPSDLIFRNKAVKQEIKIRVHSKYAIEFRRNAPAKILGANNIGGFVEYVFEFDNLNYINSWLLRFGKELVVLSPAELIQKRSALLNEMLLETKKSSSH